MTPYKTLRATAITGLLASLPLLCLGQDTPSPPGTNILLPARWSVMTGTDPGAARVGPKAVPTTLEKLNALARPAVLPRQGPPLPQYRTTRVGVAENTLWSIDAHIIEARLSPGGDYHLTLRSRSGRRIFCDLPDPRLTLHPGPFGRQMMQARAAMAARIHATDMTSPCDVPVHITGLGYYGHVRPGDGGPGNGLQLHPVVSVSFPK